MYQVKAADFTEVQKSGESGIYPGHIFILIKLSSVSKKITCCIKVKGKKGDKTWFRKEQ